VAAAQGRGLACENAILVEGQSNPKRSRSADDRTTKRGRRGRAVEGQTQECSRLSQALEVTLQPDKNSVISERLNQSDRSPCRFEVSRFQKTLVIFGIRAGIMNDRAAYAQFTIVALDRDGADRDIEFGGAIGRKETNAPQ
jgi:hypothetical protein